MAYLKNILVIESIRKSLNQVIFQFNDLLEKHCYISCPQPVQANLS